jgi:DNA-binding SARP family transcriptional activator/predicted negative regulator of RcsB-dependent stress response/DNA-binding XRE family transcriptional regulator
MGAVDDRGEVPAAGRPPFGRALRELRAAAGLTQAGLARRAGISLGAVRDLEQGRRSRPRPGSVARLAAALGQDAEGRLTRAACAIQADGAAGPAAPSGRGLWLQVLGPVMAWRDGERLELGPVRQRAVLAVLAMGRGAPVRRDAIVDAVWPENPPASAVNIVQAQVSRLRRLLPAGGPDEGGPAERGPGAVLLRAGENYWLRATAGELDLLAFDQLAGRARAAAASGNARRACAWYEQALALWHGEPAADVGILQAYAAVTGLALHRAAVVAEYARAACPLHWHDRVLPHLLALAAREPLNERAHAWLMIALAGSGQQAAALEVFARCRGRLDQQLGVRPGAELARAHELVLRQEVPGSVAAGNPQGGPGSADRAGKAAAVPAVPRQLPPGAAHFVGRDAELERLSGLLTEPAAAGAVMISAIGGIAGVGKTALALHWARQVAGQFPDGQLYVNLRGFGPGGPPVPPSAAARDFLGALGVPAERIPAAAGARAGLYRSVLAGRRVLVVLDNARDSQQVQPLLPGGPGCLALVTSRAPLTGLIAADGAHLVSVDVLTADEASDLLALRLGAWRVAAEPAAADEIVALTGRLPLALSVVAARAAAHPGYRLAALAAELAHARSRLDALTGGEVSADVRAAFSWSCRRLTPGAARMFRLLGVHPGPGVSVAAAASLAGISRPRASRALAELTATGLFSEPAPGRYACHDLVRAYAAELGSVDDDSTAATRRMLDHYLHTACAARRTINPASPPPQTGPPGPGVHPEELDSYARAMAWFGTELPVLLPVITVAVRAGLDGHAQQLPHALSSYLFRSGQLQEWAETMGTSLAAARRRGDVAAQGRAHHSIGAAFTELGRFDEASAHLRDALVLFDRAGDHQGEGRTHNGMAVALAEQQRFAESLDHARRAVAAHALAGDRNGEATALNMMGSALTRLGDHDQAVGCCRRALEICAETGNRELAANTRDTIGQAYHNRGQHAQAISCYRQAIAECGELGFRWGEGDALMHLGDAHCALGHGRAARQAWRRALAIFDDMSHRDADVLRAKLREPGQPGARSGPAGS